MLEQCSGRRRPDGSWEPGWDRLDVRALREGDAITPWETVMTIEGPYSLFAHLETVYLGTLARRTLIMRNVAEVVEAAHGKPILFFPARHDHWLVQTGDGWAAHVAGAIGVSTDAQASWWGGRGVGTVPHGLIAAYGGDTVAAAAAFARRYADEMNVTVLVDFDERLRAHRARRRGRARARAVGRPAGHLRPARRHGARAAARRGRAEGRRARARPARPLRARRARASATCASSCRAGSTPSASARSRPSGVPVDSYGVGSSLIRGANDFTADVVMVDGKPCAKVGRGLNPNPRLEPA